MRNTFQRLVIRFHSWIMWRVSKRYRRDATMRWSINQLALGFGVDYQDFGEGTSTWDGV